MWNQLRERDETERAQSLKGSRWALVKNPEDLTRKQKRKLRAIEADNQVLYTSYLLKEQLRHTLGMKGKLSTYMLGAWLHWAEDSKIGPLVEVARSIRNHRDGIECALVYGLSNCVSPTTRSGEPVFRARPEGKATPVRSIARPERHFYDIPDIAARCPRSRAPRPMVATLSMLSAKLSTAASLI
ncbi:MAG: hypothetical protein RLZZ450_367 [Pseudomonadota bacterium]|jgi:hypothetical protein